MEDQPRIKVMVVDDHPMWRDAVERDLQDHGFDVVGVAANGSEALARFPACRPHVVVLDLQIPAPNGVEVTASMVRDNPAVRVLILSASGEQQDVLDAVKAGATGYLVKSASRAELLAALLRVAEGDTVFTPGLAGLVLGEYRRLSDAPPVPDQPDTPRLTERETEVLRHDPSARVLILSASGEQEDVLEAVKAGATGYLVKSASRAELLDAVRRVARGDTVFTPGLAGLVLGEYRRLSEPAGADPGQPTLTERETEVLRMVAKGMSYKQIAERLVLSHRTVQNHVQNTLRKLQMHNRVELTRYAIAQGLDEDDADEE